MHTCGGEISVLCSYAPRGMVRTWAWNASGTAASAQQMERSSRPLRAHSSPSHTGIRAAVRGAASHRAGRYAQPSCQETMTWEWPFVVCFPSKDVSEMRKLMHRLSRTGSPKSTAWMIMRCGFPTNLLLVGSCHSSVMLIYLGDTWHTSFASPEGDKGDATGTDAHFMGPERLLPRAPCAASPLYPACAARRRPGKFQCACAVPGRSLFGCCCCYSAHF